MHGKPQKYTSRVQACIEAHAQALAQHPEVDAARREGEALLAAAIPMADPASLARFPAIAREITLSALIGLADGRLGEDLPRLIMRPPRRRGTQLLPGNRGLHDNPDTFYRLVPLDGRSHFLLEGHVPSAPFEPARIFEVSALTEKWQTLANLSREDLGIAPGRRFRILFSPEAPSSADPPADHRVRITPDAEMLLLRETLADWSVERPCALETTNFVDRGGERSEDPSLFIEAATRRVRKWFSEAARLTSGPLSQPANFFPPPVISGEHGKLVTMAYSIGHFHVRPGDALVLRIDPGNAAYVGTPVTNLFGTTNRNLARGASWNSHQATADRDGRITLVLALEDPGCRHWLDPDGLERGFLFVRWAGLDPEPPPRRMPAIESSLVEATTLRQVLPEETLWLSPEARIEWATQREADHALRFEEIR